MNIFLKEKRFGHGIRAIVAVAMLSIGGHGMSGCAAMLAFSGPDHKDISVVGKRNPRSRVVAELGTPALTETKNGVKSDLFSFKQGTTGAGAAFRGTFYLVADFFTLFLSELLFIPLEGALGGGSDVQVRVFYDKNDLVKRHEFLKDDRFIKMEGDL